MRLPDAEDEAAGRTVTGQRAGDIPAGILVGAGAGDNAGAALGLGAGPGDVVISIGTSGTVFAVAERQSHDVTGAVAGFADASGRFLPLICLCSLPEVVSAPPAAEQPGPDAGGLGRRGGIGLEMLLGVIDQALNNAGLVAYLVEVAEPAADIGVGNLPDQAEHRRIH